MNTLDYSYMGRKIAMKGRGGKVPPLWLYVEDTISTPVNCTNIYTWKRTIGHDHTCVKNIVHLYARVIPRTEGLNYPLWLYV